MNVKLQKPQFTPTISFGQMLQIVLIIVAALSVFYEVRSNSEANTKMVGALSTELESQATRFDARMSTAAQEYERDSAQMDSRIRYLEREMVRADERFSSVLTVLGRIESRIERMEQKE